jgi:hypothetical protein
MHRAMSGIYNHKDNNQEIGDKHGDIQWILLVIA